MPRGNVREELIVLDDRGMSAPLVARRFRMWGVKWLVTSDDDDYGRR